MSFLQMSFAGAVMILVIAFIRLIAVNRLPKKVFLFLWGAVLLRLIVPFSISSSFSIYSMANRNVTVQEAIVESPVADFIPIAPSEIVQTSLGSPNTDVTQVITNAVQSDPISWPFVIWCAGMLACVLYFAISYLKCHFEFRTSLPVSDDFVSQWLREHSLRRKIKVRQSDRISAPLSYGFLRPIILLPSKVNWKNYMELSYVLMHEYIHIRRFDLLTKLVLVFTCCIHWFNPMVWLMYLLFNRDLELACDESVVKQFGESSKETYAGALISMEEKRSLLMPFCNSFSKTAIEERIRAIMKTKKVTVGILIVSVIAVATVIVVFATSGKTALGEHVAANFDVPDVVLEQAKEYVLQNYNKAIEDDPNISWDHFNYIDWRIENLEHVYTYEDFVDHADYEIYRMNYRFLSGSPEDVLLIGGMTMTEDGWVAPSDSDIYMAFKREHDALTYHTVLCVEFCSPGDVAFTHDLYFTITGKWIPMIYDTADELSGDVAAMVKSVSEDSVTVDIVEVIADRNNLEAGYVINNPDSEETTWKCNENTIFTFVDWNGDFIDSERPELYWTMDFDEFKKYIESYPEGAPSVPLFFRVEDDVVISAWEESWLTAYQDVEVENPSTDDSEGGTSSSEADFNKMAIETALENSELCDIITVDNIGIDYIYEGAFTKPGEKEVFVDCRFFDLPHTGGLDRRMFLLFDEESSELIAFKEIAADKMDFTILPCADGHCDFAVCANTTYQGITTQILSLFEIQGNEWIEKPIGSLEELLGGMEEYFLWLGTDDILVTPSKEEAGPGEELARLEWNPDTEQFEVVQISDNNDEEEEF